MKNVLTFWLLFTFSAMNVNTFANPVKQDSLAKSHFYSAKAELEKMLSGEIPLDYEKAVFITENAYWDNSVDYAVYKSILDIYTLKILNLILNNDKESQLQFKNNILYSIDQQKEQYRKVLTNWAIFTYLTDTTFRRLNNEIIPNFPFQYSYDDPLGTTDWGNSQVLSLLANKKGNCYALSVLFKIFSERFNSNAGIATAPGHVFIVHEDINGTPFNIELASKTFVGTGSIKTLTNTTHEAVVSGISMRTLNIKQSVALCLVYLAKGYEYKFKTKSDDFILQCSETALKYDSLNLNAMLLKAGVIEERLINKNKSVAQLQNDKQFKELEKLTASLYKLGYREMPIEIKNLIISRMQNDTNAVFIAKNYTPNPFKHINSDPKDTRYATLSWGLFDEIHETKPFEQYSRTVFDTKNQKISEFKPTDTLYNHYNFDPVVFAWNVDPLASQYPQLSPYAFCANNPIYFVDIDGRVLWDPQAKKEVIYNEESKKFMYADGSELSETYKKQAMPTLQKLTSSDVGVNLVKSMQAISTKIIIDETDKKTIKSNPNANSTVLREVDENGNFITNSEGLSEEATIVPNWGNITANAKSDNMDIDEKLLATMVVEFGHMSTKEQISLENSLSDIYTNSNSFAQVYNPLMNSAIQSEIAYRKEKGQTIDKSVFGFYNKISTQKIGKGLKLSEENQKIYDSLK